MKRTFSILGIVVGALLVLFGILVISNAMGGDTGTASSAGILYDSGYATFGGDFYSYVNNNAQEAAAASRMTARNLDDIALLLKNFCGILLMGLGLLSVCAFGIILGGCEKKPAAAVSNAVPSAEEPVSECEANAASEPEQPLAETPAEPMQDIQ